jgi:hypothetical protein
MPLPNWLQRPRVLTYRFDPPARILAKTEAPPEDNAMDRIVKYIPGEVVGSYVSLSGLIMGLPPSAHFLGLRQITWYWIGFGVMFVLSPIWMYLSTDRPGKAPQWYQVIITPVAFFFWAFALGGPFKMALGDFSDTPAGSWSSVGASILLTIATIFFGLFDLWLDRRKQARGR